MVQHDFYVQTLHLNTIIRDQIPTKTLLFFSQLQKQTPPLDDVLLCITTASNKAV